MAVDTRINIPSVNAVRAARWRARNPERHLEVKRRYRLRHPDRISLQNRIGRLRRFFGMSIEDYESKLASQNGVCAICKKPPIQKRLAVDHCHKENKNRGLLCINCNRGVGNFFDDPALLQAAINYLEQFRCL